MRILARLGKWSLLGVTGALIGLMWHSAVCPPTPSSETAGAVNERAQEDALLHHARHPLPIHLIPRIWDRPPVDSIE